MTRLRSREIVVIVVRVIVAMDFDGLLKQEIATRQGDVVKKESKN